MEPRTRNALTALVCGIILISVDTGSASAHRAGSGRMMLTVAIDDRADVPEPFLEDAKERAADVFRMSSVDIVWVTADDGRRLTSSTPFTVIIAMTPASVSSNVTGSGADVIGQAVPDVGRAYVYYDRVLGIVTPSRDVVTVLGDVMAHELGHLLLPRGHAIAGIMRPEVNMTSRLLETFNRAQGNQLRKRIILSRQDAETN